MATLRQRCVDQGAADMTHETNMWCERDPEDGVLKHFYCNTLSVRMHETGWPEILHVNVVEDDAGTHFGWWDEGRQRIDFVYQHEILRDMCFPYGPEAEEERGRGRRIRVRTDILETYARGSEPRR